MVLMRAFLKILAMLLLPVQLLAQRSNADSLRMNLAKATQDSVRYILNYQLNIYYEELNADSALYYGEQALAVAKRNRQKLAEAEALTALSYQLMAGGKYRESLDDLLQAFKIAQNQENEKNSWLVPDPNLSIHNNRLLTLARIHNNLGNLMNYTENREQEIFHFKEAIRLSEAIENKDWILITTGNLALTYYLLNKLDTALYYAKWAESVWEAGLKKNGFGWPLTTLGDIYLKKQNLPLAMQYYHEAISVSKNYHNLGSLTFVYFSLTKHFIAEKSKDSSLYYSIKTSESLRALGFGSFNGVMNMGTAYENLYLSYQLGNQSDSAGKYLALALVTKDSLYKQRIKSLTEFQNQTFAEQLKTENLEKERMAYQNKVRTYAMVGGLFVLLLIGLLLYRNNIQKQKANKVLETTLSNLKSTQSQLIQSEKMASLGELTAGIAHEIQNPLNFVNNFSEVNKEMVDEAAEEINKGNYEEVKFILNDIKENSEKINHHGKRADAIVKGMLQHSQASTGKKEPTNINALADEYLRLAYHGLRAKDKEFNATMKTDFDERIGNINIIPQNIGRVLLNLYNNAFYAVCEKKKQQTENYEPTVSISTKKITDMVIIKVADNGFGIPQKIVDKIFQPFFTTKPTGQGTGLGLSLSYDIVKAHGGELKVETKEGEGSEFIIQLPF